MSRKGGEGGCGRNELRAGGKMGSAERCSGYQMLSASYACSGAGFEAVAIPAPFVAIFRLSINQKSTTAYGKRRQPGKKSGEEVGKRGDQEVF